MILSGGGTIQFQKDKFTNGTTSSSPTEFFISLSPGLGYFVIDNLAVGVTVPVYYNGTRNNVYYVLGIGPFAKYYFANNFFVKTEIGFSFLHNISSSATNEHYISISPAIGYAIFLNPKVSLEPGLSYEFDNKKFNVTSTEKISSLRLELKFNIFL